MKIITIIYFFIILALTNYTHSSFQISIFSRLNEKNKDKNISISPLSIFQTLSLLANGANGETRNEILKLLDDKLIEEINILYFKILSILKDSSSLEISNAIMSRLSPLPEYVKFVKLSNFSRIMPLKSLKQIHKWCEFKTHGKIRDITYELDNSIFMIILNLINFKLYWANPFSKELTISRLFYTKQYIQNVNMMRMSGHFAFFEDSNLQAIKLNFLRESMSSLIILPKMELDINEFINILEEDDEYLYTIYNNLKTTNINLEMPKFEIRYEEKLKELFKDMGVNLAFNNSADFSYIRSQNDLKIDEIIHKIYLNINEEGTDTHHIKDQKKQNSFSQLETSINIIINRPFLFILRNSNLPKNFDIIFISKVEKVNM